MMKASPGARSWIAAGVRHELLSRVLPALRHDMVGPVSVIRMGLLMLKRQVASPTIDPESCGQRVALIEDQLGELTHAMRSLRDWELATTDEGITRHALVRQCVTLLRPAFSMHDVALEVDPALETPSDDEVVRPHGAALRYMLLGVLSYLHDSAENIGTIHVEPDGDDALRLRIGARAESGEGSGAVGAAHRAPRKLAIDAVAMQSLADDLGYEVEIAGDASARFALSTAASATASA